MSKNYTITKLYMVWTHAELIIKDGKSSLLDNDLSKTKEFRKRLAHFLAKVKKGWMGKKYSKLNIENQRKLSNLIRDLYRLDMDAINHILLIERGSDLLISLRKIDAPLHTNEEEKYDTPIDISNWFYSSRLIDELTHTDAPN